MITVEDAIALQHGSSGFLLQYRNELAENDRVAFPQGTDDVLQLAVSLGQSPVYTWSRPVKRIVDESCVAYPLDDAIRSLHYFHQPAMFWVFDDAVLWVQSPRTVPPSPPELHPVDAILITPYTTGTPRTAAELTQEMLQWVEASAEERADLNQTLTERVTGIQVTGFSSLRTGRSVPLPIGSLPKGSRVCTPILTATIEFGRAATVDLDEIIDEQQDDPTILAEQTHLRQWVLAAAALIKQRILVNQQQFATRGERKRLDKLALPTSVMTITLRRTAHEGSETGQGDVEWSHRWIVRGHWRQQWYPSQDEHRVIWIPPYVKGPDDAPLVVRPAVYAVAR